MGCGGGTGRGVEVGLLLLKTYYSFKFPIKELEVYFLCTYTVYISSRYARTDKKDNEIFLIYKEIQTGAVAKSNMTKYLLISSHIIGSPSSYI